MYHQDLLGVSLRILPWLLPSILLSSANGFDIFRDLQTCHVPSFLHHLQVQDAAADSILDAIVQPAYSPKPSSPRSQAKLVYVTPWNGHGYDLAKWHAAKFTHIAPVWYQLTMEKVDQKIPKLTGQHDVDESWLRELKQDASPKIVPRVQLQLTKEVAEAILYYPRGQANAIAETLLEEVERCGYDGLTLEMPAPHVFKALIRTIGEELHASGKELILVIPPMHTPEQSGTVFGADEVQDLADAVDHFSVMTYDHAGALGKEGPNAPLPWMKEVIGELIGEDEDDVDDLDDIEGSGSVRSKILLGLPFYGYKFSRAKGSEAYTASNYKDFLREHKDALLQWDSESVEHRIVAGAGRKDISILWYPSLLSLLYRLQLAEEMGVGIAIWELGQGLDQFIDIL